VLFASLQKENYNLEYIIYEYIHLIKDIFLYHISFTKESFNKKATNFHLFSFNFINYNYN